MGTQITWPEVENFSDKGTKFMLKKKKTYLPSAASPCIGGT